MASMPPAAPSGVADHGLGRADRERGRVLAEDPVDRLALAGVVVLRRGAVRVDVVDVGRRDAGVGDRLLHAARRALAARRRRRDVEGVGAGAVADHLAEDAGAAGLGVLERLQHQDAGALRHHEAVAVAVERAARPLGLVVPRRERTHRDEAADTETAQRRLGRHRR